jgi:hypothetical protein
MLLANAEPSLSVGSIRYVAGGCSRRLLIGSATMYCGRRRSFFLKH